MSKVIDVSDLIHIGHSVLVDCTNSNDFAKYGDIYVAEMKKPETIEGIVVALGKYSKKDFDVALNDKVLFKIADTMIIKKLGRTFRIVKNNEILAITE